MQEKNKLLTTMSIKLICILITLFLTSFLTHSNALIKIKLNEDKSVIYLFDPTLRKREDIFTYCSNFNGSMAKIPNASIQALISPILTGHSWFDAKETRQGSRIYQTSNGEILQYFNWASGQPDVQCSGGCCVFVSNSGKWYDYKCEASSVTLCQITVRKNIADYILSKIPEQNISPESFTILIDMNIPEYVKMIQSNLSILESKSNILKSEIDQLHASFIHNVNSINTLNDTYSNAMEEVHHRIYSLSNDRDNLNASIIHNMNSINTLNETYSNAMDEVDSRIYSLSNESETKFLDLANKHDTNSILLESKIDSINTSLLNNQILFNATIKESIKLVNERLQLLSNSSNMKFIDHDKKHETSNDSMEYLQEEIKREKEERKTIQITFLVLIILNIFSLVSIVCYLAFQKRHKSRSVSKNVYSGSLLCEEKMYEMVM